MKENVSHTSVADPDAPVYVAGVATCPTCGAVLMDALAPCAGCWE